MAAHDNPQSFARLVASQDVSQDPFRFIVESDDELRRRLMSGCGVAWGEVYQQLRSVKPGEYTELLPGEPTKAEPGTEAKVDVMTERERAGESLCHDGDTVDMSKCGMLWLGNYRFVPVRISPG
jgi:hypothetical protein